MESRRRRTAVTAVLAMVLLVLTAGTGSCFISIPSVVTPGDGGGDGSDGSMRDGGADTSADGDGARPGDSRGPDASDVFVDAGAPNVLVTGRCQPYGIVAEEGGLLWGEGSSSEGGAVETCALPGCAASVTPLYGKRPSPVTELVANNEGYVAWAEVGDAGASVVVGANDGTILAHVAGNVPAGQGPHALAINSLEVFWTQGAAGSNEVNTVMAGALQEILPPIVIGSGKDILSGVASDPINVYWSYWDRNEVIRCPTTGCDAGLTVLARGYDGGAGPEPVALGSGVLYWAEESLDPFSTPGAIELVATSGGMATILSPGPESPSTVIVDENDVYWPDDVTGKIFKCAQSGCGMSPTVVIAGQSIQFSTRLATDATYLYWTDYGHADRCDGAIMFAPK